jgi:hypothetical protein
MLLALDAFDARLQLIESFRFSPSKEKIFWQMAGITTPVVVGSDNKAPQLPLIIERIANY